MSEKLTVNATKGAKGFSVLHGAARGHSKSPTYSSWCSMRSRCAAKGGRMHRYYSSRGIKVCERWKLFANFLADMGERPSKLHTLDRFPNNDGNYEPGNCRWATKKQQSNNQRQHPTRTIIDLAGQQFGKLLVIKLHGRQKRVGVLWDCECQCGNKHKTSTSNLRSGHTKSCGCLNVEVARRKAIALCAQIQQRRLARLSPASPNAPEGEVKPL